MLKDEVIVLQRALERQKKARIQAEKILEAKSKELYDTAEHLKRSNLLLRNLLEEKSDNLDITFLNIIDPYVVMNLNFDVIKTNDSAKEFLGFDYKTESLNLRSLVHPDFEQYTTESIQALLEIGFLKNYQAKIYVKNREIKYVQINASLIYDIDGKPVAAQGIIRDITQEMEIKQLLENHRKQLNVIVENSPLGIVLSSGSKIIKANNAFVNMLGYSEAELKKMSVDDFTFKEEGKEDEAEKLRDQINSGALEKFNLLKKYIKKDQSLLSTKVTVNFLKVDGEDNNYQVAVIEDITKELEAKERLQVERKKYRDIITNMNLGLVEVDTDNCIQTVNQSFCKMIGFKEEELLGEKANEVMDFSDIKTLQVDDVTDSNEYRVKNKLGELKHWLVSWAPRYDEVNKSIGSIGTILDITNHKELELQKEALLKELQISNKELQEYAHIVSHDLKSPLRSISALASWLKEDYEKVLDENGINQLQLMQEKVEGMDTLIGGILRYSSIDRKKVEEKAVNLNTVVKEICEIIFVPDHVTINIENTLPTLIADKTKIHQLFQNLLSNAVMHILDEEGLVTISSEETNSYYKFIISDNGIGIPPEYHEKIFKVFQSLSTDKKSTGIGLSIVKKIVDIYQGEIWIESEVGKGTTFYFTIKKDRI